MDDKKNDIPADEVDDSTDTLNTEGPTLVEAVTEGLDDMLHPNRDKRAEENR